MSNSQLILREAERGDLETILSLLRDDVLGAERETDDMSLYTVSIYGRPR